LRKRPPVTAYVTREHPETGFDELLVFDVPGMPEFTGVVPGGGIEEGESIGETGVREVKEETGLDVEFVREVGVLEGCSYVQARPTGPTEETWEHEGVVCRWVPVRADLEVWGQRGDLIHALVRRRVVGYVTRGRELLVFEHAGMTQLPAGRIDAHESLEEGLVREVAEETGLDGVRVVRELADAVEFARLFGPGVHESHALHAVTDAETPDEWGHHVTGTGMDSGMVLPCRWVPLDEPLLLWGKPDPLLDELRRSIPDS
jgi:8-oxo-dGTP pyrophosphatase MutT (NUDIX family)